MSVSSLVSMMGRRFPSGLVLVVVLGLGLTTSYKIDDPFPSEWEKDSVQDMTDEMNKLDELNHKKKDEEQAKRSDPPGKDSLIENEWLAFKENCLSESDSKIPEKEIVERKQAFLKALNKNYQILQHGKGSIISDESWIQAKRSEVCSACVLEKICASQNLLTHLGIGSNR